MSKQLRDLRVISNQQLHHSYSLLKLSPVDNKPLPEIKPGQFVQVSIPDTNGVMLRRPISVNNVTDNTLWLLIRRAGAGTETLANLAPDAVLNLLLPLGNGFTLPTSRDTRALLVGGGVGIAPMLYLGHCMLADGIIPNFLIGARSQSDLLQLDELRQLGPVYISTDDGSAGHPGVVTQNPELSRQWDVIYCCGPAPMMHAVARHARAAGTDCYVSLENTMACGIGACLCCVEDTVNGNVCVCTEGPVFNINQLKWQD